MIHNIMVQNIVRIPSSTSFDVLLKRFGSEQESRLIYVEDEDGKLLGIISAFDLLKACCGSKGIARLLGMGDDPTVCEALQKNKRKTAVDFMEKDFISVSPVDDMKKAVDIIVEKQFLALPVVGKDGKAMGEISRKTLMKVISDINWEALTCRQ
jgi:CBS domain-containing protein